MNRLIGWIISITLLGFLYNLSPRSMLGENNNLCETQNGLLKVRGTVKRINHIPPWGIGIRIEDNKGCSMETIYTEMNGLPFEIEDMVELELRVNQGSNQILKGRRINRDSMLLELRRDDWQSNGDYYIKKVNLDPYGTRWKLLRIRKDDMREGTWIAVYEGDLIVGLRRP